MSTQSIVIIPTYNELENVDKMTRAVMRLNKVDILYVDDNSPDGTSEKIQSLMEEFPGRVFLERRSGKLGLGTAYIHGFKWATSRNYPYIFEMD